MVQAPRMEPLHAGLLDLWSELGRRLADQIGEMQRQGTIAGWVGPEPMAALLIAVATGWCSRSR